MNEPRLIAKEEQSELAALSADGCSPARVQRSIEKCRCLLEERQPVRQLPAPLSQVRGSRLRA